MADSAAVTVTTDYDAKARVRVLEAAMRKIMAPTCQCVSCVTLREALESAPSPQPSPPEVEREGEMPRCFDCGREMLAGEPHYMVVGASFVGRRWRCQGCLDDQAQAQPQSVTPERKTKEQI